MFPIGAMLTLKERRGRLILSPSAAFRILFAVLFALSVFTLLSGALFYGETEVFTGRNAVPIALTALTLLALFYDERWIFDARAGSIESRVGLIVLARRTSIPLSGVSEIRLISFTKGRMGQAPAKQTPFQRLFMPAVARLAVVNTEGLVLVIDTAKAGRIEALKKTGRKIAEYCSLNFKETPV